MKYADINTCEVLKRNVANPNKKLMQESAYLRIMLPYFKAGAKVVWAFAKSFVQLYFKHTVLTHARHDLSSLNVINCLC